MKKIHLVLGLAALISAIPAMGCSAGAGSGDDGSKVGKLLSPGQTILRPVAVGDEWGKGIYIQTMFVVGDGSGDIDCYFYNKDWELLIYANNKDDGCYMVHSCYRGTETYLLERMNERMVEECPLAMMPAILQVTNNGHKVSRYKIDMGIFPIPQ